MDTKEMFDRLLELSENRKNETTEEQFERKMLWKNLMYRASQVDMPKTKNKSDLKLKKRKRR